MLAVPQEPWTAAHETKVAVGPKGMIIGGIICYDGEYRPSALAAASAWLMSRWIHAMIGHPNGSSRSLVLHVSPGDFPEIVRDTVFKGAELVVRIQVRPLPAFTMSISFLITVLLMMRCGPPCRLQQRQSCVYSTRFLFGVCRVHEPVQCAAGGHCEGTPLSHLRIALTEALQDFAK